jgi:phytoene desaturase
MMAKKIAIIGAGFGGLASAALLAKEGFEVSVFEKNPKPGGRATLYSAKGFNFDMGPSWYMMPEVFDRFFSEFGKTTSDYYTLVRLDPEYRVFFGDSTQLDIPVDEKSVYKIFEKLEKGSSHKLKEYLAEAKIKYDVSMESILYRNTKYPWDLLTPQIMKHGKSMHLFSPMEKYIKKYFKNPKIQQILEYNLVFLGCSPQNAPSLFSLISYASFKLGIWYPMGGIYEIVKAFEKLGKEFGVKYYYNSPVTKLGVENDTVKTITVRGKKKDFDIVISNADYAFTESILSNQKFRTYTKEYWEKKTFAPSAFLLFLGVKGKLPKLLHHTLYFGNDWKGHFDEVFHKPVWPKDPSIYISKPSATDPSVAPKGYENIMILVPISTNLEDSTKKNEEYGEYILTYIEEKLDVKLKKNIVYKKIFSISDYEKDYNSYKGNALGGLAHTFFQSSIWRPQNRNSKLKNLYYAGAGTNPGIGVPPAIISGHLVQDRILTEYGKPETR